MDTTHAVPPYAIRKQMREATLAVKPTKRYCPMCETWSTKRECKECGMPTEKPAKENK